MKPQHIGILVAVYIATSALSFGGFRIAMGSSGGSSLVSNLTGGSLVENLIQPIVPKSSGGVGADDSLPKTEECPINGEKYNTKVKDAWVKQRPLFVMIENHPEARPQSGLGSADIVYEAVVEGGITRFMGGYYCQAQTKDAILAPVRSARQMFIDYASEYNFPLYAHVGGSNGLDTDPRVRALEHLTDYGWTGKNDLNQFSIGYPVFVRNYDRLGAGRELATEHTMEASTQRLWDYATTKRGLSNVDSKGIDWTTTFTKWAFMDEATADKRGSIKTVSYEFWAGFQDFAVKWDYDAVTNAYFRSMAGAKHVDQNDQKQLTAKNVVVLFLREEGPVDTHKHMYYKTNGTGKAMIYQNGQQIEAVWSKKDRLSRMMLTDKKGLPVKLVRGKIWVSVIPESGTVTAL